MHGPEADGVFFCVCGAGCVRWRQLELKQRHEQQHMQQVRHCIPLRCMSGAAAAVVDLLLQAGSVCQQQAWSEAARSVAVPAGEEIVRLQLCQLQSELEALQQELVASGAAAAGGGPVAGGGRAARLAAVGGAGAGAGSGPLSLADALRELGQWQRRVQDMEAQLDEVRTGRC